MTGFTHDAFDASTVKGYLEKIENNPDFAVKKQRTVGLEILADDHDSRR